MSVNDELPWIESELTLIRDAVARDIPVLGHCLGGQLMSRALGGTVRKNAVREIGWGEVSVAQNFGDKLAEERAWFGDEKNAIVFHWHGETFSLPAGATHLLSSKHCANQAFVLGKHLALQCHVEMTDAMIRDWCAVGADEISANAHTVGVQSATAIQNQIPQNLPPLQKLAEQLYTHWIRGLAN